MTVAPRRAAVLALALAASSAFAADWPQWRGPARDGHAAADVAPPAILAGNPPAVWKAAAGFGLDSPVVAAGRAYFLEFKDNKEVVRSVDAATGKPVWSVELDEAFKDGQSQSGPRCTAVVDAGRVYVQSCRGQLKCLSADDGKTVWATNFVTDFGATFIGEKGKAEGSTRHGNTGSPVVDGDHLIAGVGGKDAAYVCFDKATGKVVWKTPLEDVPAYAAPVVATIAGRKQIVAFTTAGVVGIDRADGKLLWRVPAKTALGRHVTTPVVVGDVVVVGSHQIGLIGVRVTAAADGLKAEQAWATKDAMPNFSSCVAINGTHVIGVGQAQKLFCVEAATGKIAWSHDASLGSKHTGLIVVGQSVLALSDTGELAMFAADTTGYKEQGRATVAGKNWCTPAYVDGRLFVRDNQEVRCVELGK